MKVDGLTRNSSADERANVNFLYDDIDIVQTGQNKQLSSRYIAHNKVHFACGKHIVGLEQERTSCNSGETEKIEKQTSHGV